MSKGDAARRKQLQRDRDRALGLVKVEKWVAAEHAQALRDFADSLPPPKPPTDPRQIDWLREIEAELAGSMEPGQSGNGNQGSLI